MSYQNFILEMIDLPSYVFDDEPKSEREKTVEKIKAATAEDEIREIKKIMFR